MNKLVKITVIIAALGLGVSLALKPEFIELEKIPKLLRKNTTSPELPISQTKGTSKEIEIADSSPLENKDILNILLLGIDRRSKQQTGFNTDTMILLSVNPKDNIALLTSVPRDLWINGNKINSLYSTQGENTLINAFEKVTDLEIDGYIRCDFEDFRWIVDSFGGVPVDVETTFTDPSFPNNTDTGIKTVTFNSGTEKMDGDRALIFARSRKGNNGEGSDLMRAKRQHRVLLGMVDGISQPESRFWPMELPKFYEAVTQRMHTTLKLTDVRYLWDFYKDRDKYKVVSFVVDDKYVYHPGMYPNSEYHAWVFIPREGSFENLHQDIQSMLYSKNSEELSKETSSTNPTVSSSNGEVLTSP